MGSCMYGLVQFGATGCLVWGQNYLMDMDYMKNDKVNELDIKLPLRNVPLEVIPMWG